MPDRKDHVADMIDADTTCTRTLRSISPRAEAWRTGRNSSTDCPWVWSYPMGLSWGLNDAGAFFLFLCVPGVYMSCVLCVRRHGSCSGIAQQVYVDQHPISFREAWHLNTSCLTEQSIHLVISAFVRSPLSTTIRVDPFAEPARTVTKFWHIGGGFRISSCPSSLISSYDIQWLIHTLSAQVVEATQNATDGLLERKGS